MNFSVIAHTNSICPTQRKHLSEFETLLSKDWSIFSWFYYRNYCVTMNVNPWTQPKNQAFFQLWLLSQLDYPVGPYRMMQIRSNLWESYPYSPLNISSHFCWRFRRFRNLWIGNLSKTNNFYKLVYTNISLYFCYFILLLFKNPYQFLVKKLVVLYKTGLQSRLLYSCSSCFSLRRRVKIFNHNHQGINLNTVVCSIFC